MFTLTPSSRETAGCHLFTPSLVADFYQGIGLAINELVVIICVT